VRVRHQLRTLQVENSPTERAYCGIALSTHPITSGITTINEAVITNEINEDVARYDHAICSGLPQGESLICPQNVQTLATDSSCDTDIALNFLNIAALIILTTINVHSPERNAAKSVVLKFTDIRVRTTAYNRESIIPEREDPSRRSGIVEITIRWHTHEDNIRRVNEYTRKLMEAGTRHPGSQDLRGCVVECSVRLPPSRDGQEREVNFTSSRSASNESKTHWVAGDESNTPPHGNSSLSQLGKFLKIFFETSRISLGSSTGPLWTTPVNVHVSVLRFPIHGSTPSLTDSRGYKVILQRRREWLTRSAQITIDHLRQYIEQYPEYSDLVPNIIKLLEMRTQYGIWLGPVCLRPRPILQEGREVYDSGDQQEVYLTYVTLPPNVPG